MLAFSGGLRDTWVKLTNPREALFEQARRELAAHAAEWNQQLSQESRQVWGVTIWTIQVEKWQLKVVVDASQNPDLDQQAFQEWLKLRLPEFEQAFKKSQGDLIRAAGREDNWLFVVYRYIQDEGKSYSNCCFERRNQGNTPEKAKENYCDGCLNGSKRNIWIA